MPAQQPVLYELNRSGEKSIENRQYENEGEDVIRGKTGPIGRQQSPQTILLKEHFRNDQSDQRTTHSQSQPRQQKRNSVRPDNVPEQRPASGSEGDGNLLQFGVTTTCADEGIDQYGEENPQGDEENSCTQTHTKPQDDDGY